MGMHWLGDVKVAAPLRARNLIEGSLAIGRSINRTFRKQELLRWHETASNDQPTLVQIHR
jgi:hypothetical protein